MVCLDRDADALDRAAMLAARELPGTSPPRLVHATFAALGESCSLQHGSLDGILADLGVSSWQLDEAARGFSFQGEGSSVDMRFDQRFSPFSGAARFSKAGDWMPVRWSPRGPVRSPRGASLWEPGSPLSAAQLLCGVTEGTLASLLWLLGNEPRADLIASAIVRARESSPPLLQRRIGDGGCVAARALPACVSGVPWLTSAGLASLVAGSTLGGAKHPATRSFQAVRAAVNDELGHLWEMLCTAPALLRPGARIAVITFHSLEDALVTAAFRAWCSLPAAEGSAASASPVGASGGGFFRPLVQGVRDPTPSAAERRGNRRARSARLRVIERGAAAAAVPPRIAPKLPAGLRQAVGVAQLAQREAWEALQEGGGAGRDAAGAARARRMRRK